jgi:hypothetical protein
LHAERTHCRHQHDLGWKPGAKDDLEEREDAVLRLDGLGSCGFLGERIEH